MNEEITGIEVKGEIYPIKDEKTSEEVETLKTKIADINIVLDEIKNKSFKYPNYGKQKTITTNRWVADEDVYITHTYVSTTGSTEALTINGVEVTVSDSSGSTLIKNFAGYAKKGDEIRSQYLANKNVTRIFPLIQD